LHYLEEEEETNLKEYSLVIGNYFFNVKIDEEDELNLKNSNFEYNNMNNNNIEYNNMNNNNLNNNNLNLNIFKTANVKEIVKINERSLKLPNSIDLKKFFKELLKSFKVPKLKKSEIKLKFTVLTNLKSEKIKAFNFNNLNNFITNLSPVLIFKSSYQKKYFDENLKVSELRSEMFIGSNPISKFDYSRDERGRTDLFNLILIKTDDTKLKSLYIPNWGIIVTTSQGQGQQQEEEIVEKILISGLKRFLGFPKIKNLPEMFEIELWKEKVKEFYFEKFTEMSKLLKKSLKLNSKVIKAESSKDAFDIIEKIYNHPKFLSSAYFPDDHKFAVYLPVYLPLILPIIVGLITIIKEKRRRGIGIGIGRERDKDGYLKVKNE
jgi:hypothetical protein